MKVEDSDLGVGPIWKLEPNCHQKAPSTIPQAEHDCSATGLGRYTAACPRKALTVSHDG